MDEIRLLAGLDIGNGYVKGLVRDIDAEKEPTSVDMPSCVALDTNPTNQKWTGERFARGMQDIYNSIDVTIDSEAVRDTRHRLFGRRGVESTKSVEEFDVNASETKAEKDLSAILVLGILGAKAVQSYYMRNGELPSGMLKVSVTELCLALPIDEYQRQRDTYRDRFYQYTHYVTIHDFERPVRVELSFADVQVQPEGVSAQYAIADMIGKMGEVAVEAMLQDVRSHGMALEGITAKMICEAKNIIGIDIGEGTVNFPVHTNGQYNVDASRTFNQGYGTVLDNTLKVLQESGFRQVGNRKMLTEFLQNTSPMQAKGRSFVMGKLENEADAFATAIDGEMSAILKKTGPLIEVVYIYGGGATAMKDMLYPRLVARACKTSFTGEGFPVLCLDSSYARNMNRKGLYLVAEQIHAAKEKRAAEAAQAAQG